MKEKSRQTYGSYISHTCAVQIILVNTQTLVKSVGLHVIDVTSWLCPWSSMGGRLGSESWKTKVSA